MTSVFIGVTELDRAIRADPTVTVLDVRWSLAKPDGAHEYALGHLPGAVYVDLDSELAAPASSEDGRHPLPSLADLEAAARRWGVREGASVVVYDDNGGMSAARAWWLLRWAGVAEVRILDGGLAAWCAAGLLVEDGLVRPRPGDVSLSPGHLPVIDADDAAGWPGLLLDARMGERYRGELEPVDPRAGHVPGAVSAPTADALTPDGRVLPAPALREYFSSRGVVGDRPVAVYCGSGVTASHQVAVLQSLGIDAALYPGSWSQWSSDPGRPVATGP